MLTRPSSSDMQYIPNARGIICSPNVHISCVWSACKSTEHQTHLSHDSEVRTVTMGLGIVHGTRSDLCSSLLALDNGTRSISRAKAQMLTSWRCSLAILACQRRLLPEVLLVPDAFIFDRSVSPLQACSSTCHMRTTLPSH